MANENKTKPTDVSVEEYLETVSEKRQAESAVLIEMMKTISGEEPILWGPSIIGFGQMHYQYDTGREGEMPILAFSPRKTSLTVYLDAGFDADVETIKRLGKCKTSVACLYINKLEDVDQSVLKEMLEKTYQQASTDKPEPQTTEEFLEQVPDNARKQFDALREIIREELSGSEEVLSSGLLAYKTSEKRPRVYISAKEDYVSLYPIPKAKELQKEVRPYQRGSTILGFGLEEDLPKDLIRRIIQSLHE